MKSVKTITLLFLDILTDDRALREEQTKIMGGETYAEQMRKAFVLKPRNFFSVDASKGKFPDPSTYDAVVIGGSYEDPVAGREKPWMKRVYAYIRKIKKERVPLLGICGGLQFAVRAFGGSVIYNPKGRELGSIAVRLARVGRKDPLFKNMPSRFVVQLSHKCIARKMGPRWRHLAESKKCTLQALAIGDRIRLVQFHPEMTGRHLRAIVRTRKTQLFREGLVKNNADFRKLIYSIKNTEGAKKVLENFIRYFVLPNRTRE